MAHDEDTLILPPSWDGNDRRSNDRRNSMPQDPREDSMMNQPFWKAMSFLMVGLLAIAVWVMKANIEKLEKVSDSQIETKTYLKVIIDNNTKTDSTIKDIQADVSQLKLNDRTQEERIAAMTGRRVVSSYVTRTQAQ